MPSPLKAAHPQKSALSESLELNDSLSKELQPIVYTPEDCRKTAQNSSIVTSSKPLSQATRFQTISSNVNGENSLKTLCEIDTPHSRRKEYGQEDLDSTFIICEDIKNLKSKSPEQESLPNNNNILQRYKKEYLPVLLFLFFFYLHSLKTIAFFLFFSYI